MVKQPLAALLRGSMYPIIRSPVKGIYGGIWGLGFRGLGV